MDTSDIKPGEVEVAAKRGWRRHPEEFKARVIQLARQPGTSVAAVALANRLNANMLRRWIREAETSGGASSAAVAGVASTVASFVQLPLPKAMPLPMPDARPTQPELSAPVTQTPADITVQIHRGGTTVHAKLPLDDRSAAWLREVLG